jgi:hypothetical protein
MKSLSKSTPALPASFSCRSLCESPGSAGASIEFCWATPLSFGRGVDGGPFEHGDDDRGDGVAPVLLELRLPRRRQRADGGDERLARGDVVFGPRAPVDVLRAQIAQRLAEAVDVAQIADHQRERRFEVPLQVREVGGKQRPQARRRGEQLLIEAGRQPASSGGQRRVTALDALDRVRCHNSPSLQ